MRNNFEIALDIIFVMVNLTFIMMCLSCTLSDKIALILGNFIFLSIGHTIGLERLK